jgi:hypothetical protein
MGKTPGGQRFLQIDEPLAFYLRPFNEQEKILYLK